MHEVTIGMEGASVCTLWEEAVLWNAAGVERLIAVFDDYNAAVSKCGSQ
jgi:hypothetical protein